VALVRGWGVASAQEGGGGGGGGGADAADAAAAAAAAAVAAAPASKRGSSSAAAIERGGRSVGPLLLVSLLARAIVGGLTFRGQEGLHQLDAPEESG
jgi:hypothetical protein